MAGRIALKHGGGYGFTRYAFYKCYGWSTSVRADVRTLFPYLSNRLMHRLENWCIVERH